jgi:hypothetical protein
MGLFSFGKKQPPKEPKKINVQKVKATVTTQSGDDHYIEEVGLVSRGFYMKADISLLYNRRIKNNMFNVAQGIDVPVCNIECVTYEIEDHFVTVEKE